jgi:c-di-GMP-binding flagellar brake protein YcgR
MLARLIEGILSIRRGSKKPSKDEASPAKDGRQAVRVVCRLPVKCFSKRPWFPATVVDLSPTGMRLETDATLAKGDQMWVSFEDHKSRGSAVDVEVMWIRNNSRGCSVGLRYRDVSRLAGTWVQLVMWEVGLGGVSDSQQRRQEIRWAAGVPAEVQDEFGNHLTRAEAADVSLGGALLKSEVGIAEGQSLKVLLTPDEGLPAFTVDCRVVRSRFQEQSKQHLVSLQFDELAPKTFACLKRLVSHLVKH